jgi:hypothetical protein
MQLSAKDSAIKQITTIDSIKDLLTDQSFTGVKFQNVKLQLMQKFIEAEFMPERFIEIIKDNQNLLKEMLGSEVLPARVLMKAGQKVLFTPVGQFALDHATEIDNDIEMVLVKVLPNITNDTNNAKNTSTIGLSDLIIKDISKDLLSILPMIQSLKKQGEYFDKYLGKIFDFLNNFSSSSYHRAKSGLNFLGLVNVEFSDDLDEDLEQILKNDASFDKANQKSRGAEIKNLEEFIRFFKEDAQDSSTLKPVMIKQEVWMPISFHLNGQIIDDSQVKCYVKKRMGNILRFFIEIAFARVQLDGMIKLDKILNNVEKFHLIVHTVDSDNQMSSYIKSIFHQNLQKYHIEGNIEFDMNLAKITSINTESFDGIVA